MITHSDGERNDFAPNSLSPHGDLGCLLDLLGSAEDAYAAIAAHHEQAMYHAMRQAARYGRQRSTLARAIFSEGAL